MRTSVDVYIEHTLESLCPGHGHMALSGRFLISSRFALCAFAALCWSDHAAPTVIRCEDAVAPCWIDSGPGNQGGQSGEEVHGLKDDLSCAIAVRCLQRVDDFALSAQGEAFDGNRWPAYIPAQALAFIQLMGFATDAGMQGEP